MLAGVKAQYNRLPKAVKVFVFRGVLLIVLWNILYKFLLEPSGIPDNPLCHFFSNITAKTMGMFYPDCYAKNVTVFVWNWPVININAACNGLELLVIYTGFLVCLPTNWKRMLGYAIGGSIAILFLNYLRFPAL